jgi:uroporphyrinogen-III synthase
VRVLLTRPRAESEALAAHLAARGVDVLIDPVLRFVDLPLPALPPDVQAVLFTSAQGARALAAKNERRDVPVLAVGDATAEVARALGFRDVRSAAGDARDLAALAAAALDPGKGPVLHAAGRDVAGDVAGALAGRGFRVVRAALYAAELSHALGPATVEALAAGTLDGVLLFSPRAASGFVRLVHAAGLARAGARLVAWCLSPAVAEAANDVAWRRVAVAARPDQASLVEAVVETMRSEKAKGP